MSIVVWIFQIVLAAAFLKTGMGHFSRIAQNIRQNEEETDSGSGSRFIAIVKMVAGICLILPVAMDLLPVLTFITALVCVLAIPIAVLINGIGKRPVKPATNAGVFVMALGICLGHWILEDIPTVNATRKAIVYRNKAVAWQQYHNANAPRKGEMATDFHLWDGEGKNSVRLSDFKGKKPVALIFGSYT